MKNTQEEDHKSVRSTYIEPEPSSSFGTVENRYLMMDFWEFAIISTLMFAFFPWSLLFCLFFIGIDGTKLLVIALFHDWVKTLLAVLSVVVVLVLLVVVGLLIFFR